MKISFNPRGTKIHWYWLGGACVFKLFSFQGIDEEAIHKLVKSATFKKFVHRSELEDEVSSDASLGFTIGVPWMWWCLEAVTEASTLVTSYSTSSATKSKGSCINVDSKVLFLFFFWTRIRCWSCTSSCSKNLSSTRLWRWHWRMPLEPHRTRSPSTFMATYSLHLVNSIHKFFFLCSTCELWRVVWTRHIRLKKFSHQCLWRVLMYFWTLWCFEVFIQSLALEEV